MNLNKDGDDAEDFDPVASIPHSETLAEALLQQLEALISPDDALIAEQLVGNLNEHGYLEISVSEIAEHLQIEVEFVAYVLSQLQTLEPPGIGARDLRECLLNQLEALSEQKSPHPLAHTLIDRYLNRLGHNQLHEIARELKVPEAEVRQASFYIRNNLHPYPAHTYREGARIASTIAVYMRPDVIIRKGEGGFEVEIIEEKRYPFHISAGYGTQPLYLEQETANEELQRYIHQYADQARFFIDCVHAAGARLSASSSWS